jgi:hypothetical protein
MAFALGLVALLGCGGGGGGSSAATTPAPPPPPNLYGVAFGNSQWVSVGASGTVVTSPFTFAGWTAQKSNVTADLRSIAYANGVWMAVGDAGTIVKSSDAINWAAAASGTTQNLRAVAYGNSTWTAVGWNGALTTSPDGNTWTTRTSGTTNNLQGVAYANNGWNGTTHPQWVAVGQGDTVLLSSDAVTWTLQQTGTGNDLYGVGYNPAVSIAVTSGPGPNTTYYSGMFEVVGASGTLASSSLSIFSGVPSTWAKGTSGTGNRLSRVSGYLNGAFGELLAVGDSGTVYYTTYGAGASSNVLTLDNGNYFLADIAGYNGTWLAVGASETTFKSVGGTTWAQVN